MKISIARKDRAFAVIIALVAVTVLTILAGAFAYAMKVETRLAANTNNDEDFYWIGRGGVEIECRRLALDGNQPYTSLQQYWNNGPGDGPETNWNNPANILANETDDVKDFPIGPGTVTVSPVNLDGKININTADEMLLKQVLTEQNADPDAISSVPACILDWVQPGDFARPAGAKSDYYLGLTPSYNCKDAPMDSIGELLLVKGVTWNMYYGVSSGQDSQHQLGVGHTFSQNDASYNFALKDVFTPFSSGKVNLLTADDTVLNVLFDSQNNPNALEGFKTARDSDPPARDVAHLLAAANLDPQTQARIGNYVSVIGNTFEIHATATIGALSHEYTAIVYRNGPNVQIVSFYRSDSQSAGPK